MRAVAGRDVAPGIGVYMHRNDKITVEQLKLARAWRDGFGLFSASSLFDGSTRSRWRLSAISPLLEEMRAEAVKKQESPPPVNVKLDVTGTIQFGSGTKSGRSRRPIVP